MPGHDDYDERVKRVAVGTAISATLNERRERYAGTVSAPCELKRGGSWYCVTHDKSMTQWDRDVHCEKGKHVLAWVCSLHGFEVP